MKFSRSLSVPNSSTAVSSDKMIRKLHAADKSFAMPRAACIPKLWSRHPALSISIMIDGRVPSSDFPFFRADMKLIVVGFTSAIFRPSISTCITSSILDAVVILIIKTPFLSLAALSVIVDLPTPFAPYMI